MNVEPFRISGASRYETAAYMSVLANDGYFDVAGNSAPFAIVATGKNFPDALAAGATGIPIVLTTPSSLPFESQWALGEIDPDFVFILGGQGAVSPAVEQQILDVLPFAEVERVSGTSRYDTAAQLSRTFNDLFCGDTVFLATGENFPDALGGGPPATIECAPILLTRKDSLPSATAAELARIEPTHVVVLGGQGAVSDTVLLQAGAFAAAGAERRAGSDRYGTAVAAGQPDFSWADTYVTILATGLDYPDALAAGPTAFWWSGPVLLMKRNCIPGVVEGRVQEIEPVEIAIGGGEGVISEGAWWSVC